jgi:hypothetical protein
VGELAEACAADMFDDALEVKEAFAGILIAE